MTQVLIRARKGRLEAHGHRGDAKGGPVMMEAGAGDTEPADTCPAGFRPSRLSLCGRRNSRRFKLPPAASGTEICPQTLSPLILTYIARRGGDCQATPRHRAMVTEVTKARDSPQQAGRNHEPPSGCSAWDICLFSPFIYLFEYLITSACTQRSLMHTLHYHPLLCYFVGKLFQVWPPGALSPVYL